MSHIHSLSPERFNFSGIKIYFLRQIKEWIIYNKQVNDMFEPKGSNREDTDKYLVF